MKTPLLVPALLLICTMSLFAQEAQEAPPLPEKPVLRHPVEEVDVATCLPASARERPHVLFVNVGQALDETAFADAAAYIRMRWMITTWTNSVDKVDVAAMVSNQEASRAANAKQAVLTVYVVKDEAMANFLLQPGTWSLLNVRGLDKDGPEPLLLTKRTRQMFLKGLCFATGVGVNTDPYCAMYAESFTPSGMDKTSATIGPFAYGPLMQSLQLISGDALFAPFGE